MPYRFLREHHTKGGRSSRQHRLPCAGNGWHDMRIVQYWQVPGQTPGKSRTRPGKATEAKKKNYTEKKVIDESRSHSPQLVCQVRVRVIPSLVHLVLGPLAGESSQTHGRRLSRYPQHYKSIALETLRWLVLALLGLRPPPTAAATVPLPPYSPADRGFDGPKRLKTHTKGSWFAAGMCSGIDEGVLLNHGTH